MTRASATRGSHALIRRWAVAAAFAALALSLATSQSSAHANLVRAIPSAGSTVDDAPQVVAAEFSERLEPGFSRIDVLDTSGQSVVAAPSQVDPSNPSAMLVRVDPLADGTYVVAWRTLSTVDGHLIRGSYAFSVGEPIAAAAGGAPESALLLSPAEPVLRAALLVGAMILVGLAVHVPLIFAPAARASGATGSVPAHMRAAWLAIGLAAVAHVGLLMNQAAGLASDAGQDFGAALGSALSLGQWGTLWIIRAIFVAAVVIALTRARRETRHTVAWLPVAGLSAGLLITIALGSHAAALLESSAAASSADVVHLLAAAVWAGGLLPLLLSLQHARRTLDGSMRRAMQGQLVARFSTTATISVGALVITGLVASWLQVVELPRLVQTDYGWTLVAKLALVVPLFGIGAVNLLWTRRRLNAEEGAAAARWAPRLVAAEVLLALGVVGAVGALTSLEPARQVQLGGTSGIRLEARDGELEATLGIRPGIPGNNVATLSLMEGGEPVGDARVDLQIKFLDSDIGLRDLRPLLDDDGQYVVEGDFISLVGRWQALAIIARPGEFDTRLPFRFDVTPTGSAAGGAPPPVQNDVRRVWSLALAGLGLLLAFAALQPALWARWVGRGVAATGFASAAAGFALLVTTPEFGPTSAIQVNPVPPDEISIEAGRMLFEGNCVACHGPGGVGDGPLAAGLDPPPLDLTIHVPLHPDSELYSFVESGIDGTAMPAFGESFTVIQIWNLINFLQTLPP